MTNKRNQFIGIIVVILVIVIIFPFIVKKKDYHEDVNSISLTDILSIDKDIIALNNEANSISELLNLHDNNQLAENSEQQNTFLHSSEIVQIPNKTNDPIIFEEKEMQQIAENNKIYSVQLAALKNKQKIEELIALLRLNNYETYIKSQDNSSNTIIRLYIGPYALKEQAELAIIDLKNLTKLDGFIVSQ